MITIKSERSKRGTICPSHSHTRTVGGAVGLLLRSELGFGGQITEISETNLSVRTYVCECVDDTHFSGSKEEMAPLLLAARYFLYLRRDPSSEAAAVDRLMKITEGRPLLIAIGHGVLMEAPFARLAAILMMTQDQELAQAVLKIDEKEMYAMLEMVLDYGCTLEEAMRT